MRAGIVQQIFKDHFDTYRRGRRLGEREWRAAWDIMTCRTPAKGYHINACPNEDFAVARANSCKHRSCPRCGATETELWLGRRRRQALDCPYFHVTVTISHELHGLWAANRKLFTGILMQSAWQAVKELLADWRWLGGLPGAVMVFQSWGDELREHCHLHLVVTAGGLNPDGRWVSANKDFLLPTPVLAAKVRGKFLARLKAGFDPLTPRGKLKPEDKVLSPPPGMSVQKCLNLLNRLGRKRWHANIEPAYEHANGVFKYVGRYIRRGPLSEKRIVGYDGKGVTIAYAHPEKHDAQTFRLDGPTFIRRLLRHVPEKGTHLVRSYGLFHGRCLPKLNAAREKLGQPAYQAPAELPSAIELLRRMFPLAAGTVCPQCGEALRTVFVHRGGHSPPWRLAA